MTEFINHEFICHEENSCEMESDDQPPKDQHNKTNESANQIPGLKMSEADFQKLFQEKLRLEKEGKDIRKLATDLLEENRRLNSRKQEEEILSVKSEKNPAKIVEVIESRLNYVHEWANNRIKVYKDYIDGSLIRLQDAIRFNNQNKDLLKENLSVVQSMLETIEEQFETIQTLKEPDYKVLYLENGDCFDTVMTECKRLEDSCYAINCEILKDIY